MKCRKMNTKQFSERIPENVREKISPDALQIWHCIYDHVAMHGQTDRFDPAMQKAVRALTTAWISDNTIKTHMQRMAKAGLLARHRIIVKYTPLGRFAGWMNPFLTAETPPAGAFVRYTLPGMQPTLEHHEPLTKKPAVKWTPPRIRKKP
jgi:hypothetical protein